MSKVTVTAKTIDEAVKSALRQLQTSEEFVSIRVIEEPTNGFFGFGAKPAVVEVALLEPTVESQAVTAEDTTMQSAVKQEKEETSGVNPVEEAQLFLEKVLSQMGLKVQITLDHEEEHTVFKITGEGLGLMIGKRGQTLESIQYLTNLVANRHSKEYLRIVIDPENYRTKRQETLKLLADRMAKKVVRTNEKMALEPMNAAERKVIHTHLQNYAGISTKSHGEGNNRHLVIYPKNYRQTE